jgi:NAD-dependent dihydropyrimidine dehydrogenase PreA subunit
MSKRVKKNNWFKLFYQLAIIGLLGFMAFKLFSDRLYTPDFEAYCPFGGLQALGSFLTRDSLSCAMTSMQITMGVMLFAGVIFVSKLFCGYICPLGTVSEWIGKLGDRMNVRFETGRIADMALRSLKYGLLFITFYITLESSELFCKKFDPYYAVASGFNSDVVVLWAVIAIGAFFLGSLFLRLFWCRYLCPLGALSNIFSFTWWFAGIAAFYIILRIAGAGIPWVWLLAVIAAGGYLLEIFKKEKVTPSLIHITRNSESCTSCKLCTKKCPQGIDVSVMDNVKHVDCTLCGDCLYACPEKDTLQINRRNMKWLPAAALTVLIIIGLMLGSLYELPTIDLKWGTAEQVAGAGTFTKVGLKSIKCFGSSTAFANQMQKIEGIYGVSTYVGTHTVKILYDKSLYDDVKIQKLLFVPEKRLLKRLKSASGSVVVYSLTVDNFFDPLDVAYLRHLLLQKTEAVGYQSEFACPVIIRIYFPSGNQPGTEALKEIIQTKSLEYTENGIYFRTPLEYRVVTILENRNLMSGIDYLTDMYKPFTMRFNKYNDYTPDAVSIYELTMGGNIELKDRYSYMGSHLSGFNGIVGFETLIDQAGIEVGRVSFVDSLITVEKVIRAIKSDSLLLHYGDGTVEKVANQFVFPDSGILKEY